jgi:hypothetical protein
MSHSIIEIISSPVSMSVTDGVGTSGEDSAGLSEEPAGTDISGELFSSEDGGFS